jgi:hypothetical protein
MGCMRSWIRAIDLSQRIWGSPSGISYARPARSEMLVDRSEMLVLQYFPVGLRCVRANPASKRSPRCELTLVQLQMGAGSPAARAWRCIRPWHPLISELHRCRKPLVCATPRQGDLDRVHTNNSTWISVLRASCERKQTTHRSHSHHPAIRIVATTYVRQRSRLTCGACKTGHPVPSQEMEVSCAPRDASEARRWLLPPSQIIRHSKNLGESKDLKFDQIYMIR